MAHTNNTPFMNLPLFVGTDKPAWLTDFNSAMQAIDNTCSQQKSDIDAAQLAITALQTAMNNLHPIGSIYMSVSSTNPGTLFGGTWARIKDTFLLSAGDTYAAGSTGGSDTHLHNAQGSVGNLRAAIGAVAASDVYIGYDAQQRQPNGQGPSAATYAIQGSRVSGDKTFSHYTGVYGQTDRASSLPPYMAVYVWQRTA